MQEVPIDSILLTLDEAKAILDFIKKEIFSVDDFDAAVNALEEQLDFEVENEETWW